jgi:long-chain acyl-CoA synthetase
MDTDTNDPSFYEAIRGCDPAPWPDADSDMRWDDCMIVYTSGTTGKPKGVVLIQQNLFVDGEMINAWHGIDASTRMMCVLPVHHVNGALVTHATPFIESSRLRSSSRRLPLNRYTS